MSDLAVYVHIPFCVVKCGYCDFNTYAGLEGLKPAYGAAMLAEVRARSELLRGSRVTSISFGGGTPGEFPPESLAAVVRAVREAAATMADGAEVSLEANPGTTSFADLEVLAAAGINRVSFGAQSFSPAELRFLDRLHSPQATAASVANARRAGIASVGIDLIYGLPGQSRADWETNLDRALGLPVDHISCYALTVEEGTPLALKVERGEVEPLDPDEAAAMYEAAEARLAAAGFRQYEISNWARPGHESRHNLVYWTGGEYLGVGAGAHGFLGGERYENVAHPRLYVERLLGASPAPGVAVHSSYRPTGAPAAVDWIESRLRLIDGFRWADFPFEGAILHTTAAVLDEAAGFDLIAPLGGETGDVVRLTARGRLLHGEICARLLARLA